MIGYDPIADIEAAKALVLAKHRIEPNVLVVSPRMLTRLKEIARTVRLKTLGNYALYELDGRRWWARVREINESLRVRDFPRHDPEACGWTSWALFNRHWRRRGFPDSLEWGNERLPRKAWAL